MWSKVGHQERPAGRAERDPALPTALGAPEGVRSGGAVGGLGCASHVAWPADVQSTGTPSCTFRASCEPSDRPPNPNPNQPASPPLPSWPTLHALPSPLRSLSLTAPSPSRSLPSPPTFTFLPIPPPSHAYLRVHGECRPITPSITNHQSILSNHHPHTRRRLTINR